MQSRTQTLIFRKSRHPILAELFSYSSKGVGGINLIGFGKYGNTLKEKIIFLCKEKGIKLPFKKYVLCIENSDVIKDLEFNEVRWLELPLLLLLLQLAGQLKVHDLSNCVSSGKINMNFMLINPYIEKRNWNELARKWSIDSYIYLGEFLPDCKEKQEVIDYISLLQVLQALSVNHSGFEQVHY
jgi:hypothetical protein